MAHQRTRREFLRDSAAVGAGLWLGTSCARIKPKPPSERLNIAVIGPAGRGAQNLAQVAAENIVALCDADERMAASARAKFPDARFYADFREMLDKERKNIDAVVVSTPDHTHAPAAMMALRAGKHVYCEKPLTHSVYEARVVARMAARMKVATQMGTQIHADENYRRVVELVQTGAVGEIREVHVWVGKQWTGGGDRPTDRPPVPKGLHWDLWLGPAPLRPYHPAYVPASWRGWWDFGGGTLSDMACHYMDLPHWALDLRHPLTVEAEGPPLHPESCPAWLIVRYQYPARPKLPPVNLTWYHGGKRPPHFDEKGRMPQWGDGVLFVGGGGMLLADYTRHALLPAEKFAKFQPPKPFIPPSIGHHEEWLEACRTGSPTTCNFDYSGALAETALLGNVAYRTGKKLEWDPKRLTATNAPQAAQFLRRKYRSGWTL